MQLLQSCLQTCALLYTHNSTSNNALYQHQSCSTRLSDSSCVHSTCCRCTPSSAQHQHTPLASAAQHRTAPHTTQAQATAAVCPPAKVSHRSRRGPSSDRSPTRSHHACPLCMHPESLLEDVGREPSARCYACGAASCCCCNE
jgi:hypothetical protein